ncbi:MAG: hypothetical protein ACAI35_03370 [Candidatus Methylacidiphilales bacterium]|nr:hypothetical protein [Candidatus Methylacidiphilales bacterium]
MKANIPASINGDSPSATGVQDTAEAAVAVETSCAPSCEPLVACRHLRTKRMFIPAQAEGSLEVESERNDRAAYWCNITFSHLGCDEERAHTRLCLNHRRCYEA